MNRASVFLQAYRNTGSVTMAAAAAQIHRSIHYRRLHEDPDYKAAFLACKEEAIEVLEDEAVRRAVHGVDKPVVFQGRISLMKDSKTGGLVPVTVREYSDSLLQFLLRGAKPSKYRERHQVDHSGAVGLKFAGEMVDLLALYQELSNGENPQGT